MQPLRGIASWSWWPAILLCFAASALSASARADTKQVLAGIPASFPPHYQLDRVTGKPSGFAIDFMNAVVKGSGLEIQYRVYPDWQAVLAAMKNGAIDVIPNLGIAAERAAYIDFTAPYETFGIVIFVRATSVDILGDGDLNGRSVAVVADNLGRSLMEQRGGALLQVFQTQEQALVALLSGEVDALVYPEPVVRKIAREIGIEERIRTVGTPLAEIKRSVGVRKGKEALFAQIDAGVAAFLETPAYQEIYQKWYGKAEPYWTARRTAVWFGALLFATVAALLFWRYRSVVRLNQRLAQSLAERKQAEKALRMSEERFRAISSNTPDHVVMQDRQLRYLLVVNPQLGLTEHDMIGKTDHDFLPPEEADKLTAAKTRVLETGKPLHYETCLTSRTGGEEYFAGSYVPYFDLQGRADGLIGYFRNVTEHKVAEEKIARINRLYVVLSNINETIVRLRDSESLYEAICRILVEDGRFLMAWIGIVDPMTLWVDPIAKWGAEEGFLKARRISANPDLPEGRGPTGNAIRGGAPLVVDDIEHDPTMLPWREEAVRRGYRSFAAFPLWRGDGVVGSLNLYADKKHYFKADEIQLLETLAADISHAFAAIQEEMRRRRAEADLVTLNAELEQRVEERTQETEKKRSDLERIRRALINLVEDLNSKSQEVTLANERLKELDRLKSMFIASMSHELRTPLNSIIGFSGILLQGMTGELNVEQKDQLERVFRAGKHLLSLITDVIDISKIESGRMQAYAEEFVLQNLVFEACESLKVQFQDKGLELRRDLPAEPIVMKTDRRRFMQCLLNYLGNGVKFTTKGSVAVSARTAGESVTVSVADTGIGIKKSQMSLLFQSFVRLDSPLKMTTTGTGLGLYLTKKIATELLGGSVRAESTEGVGSTFTLTIPRVLPAAEEQIG